ncbi:Putative thiopeptide-lantipeptide biosynthesis protein [Kitasatospora sp. MMS16-BH015]|uniref:TOMM precursor leader peptide-binding protein n=1 Tax=Kitasatospora sp. MMS16-BH015 TaxID=2018025 RepID=UPI000CA2D500|nr:TOMM precursor leader peptide-binding protein [Kitasatospora sp. MMS16-BH015]AUG81080.1 Putative thiopeptide-lantipeptide biosynthesis protein [Kitasatospora sp. MMS16-BH015]
MTAPRSTPVATTGLPLLDAQEALAATAGPALVLLESWSLGLAEELSRHALTHPVRQVVIRCDGALAVIGPVLHPGAGACLSCVEYQRLATLGGRVPWQSRSLEFSGLLTPALTAAAEALATDLLRTTETADGHPAGPTVHLLHQSRATWSTHRVRPFGGCAVCSPLPPDSAEAARLPYTPRPLPDPRVLRGPNPATTRENLRRELYDHRFGPVRRLLRAEDSVHCLSTAHVTDGRLLDDGGYGRAADFDSGERIALFEGVERLTGMRPTGRRTSLRASFAELGPARAVDPERLGLPDPRWHGHPDSFTVPYHPQLELDWVHGWSLTRQRPLAVPEHVAYWEGTPAHRPRVVYESSNGCGLGNSPQEAALYGLFEVAERDAFLMAWYAAAPLRRIALPADPELAALDARTELAGYRLTLLDATNDLGIPAVLAVYRYRGGHPEAPRVFLAAGAHHDPLTAIRSAMAEVVTNVHAAPHRARSADRPWDRARLLPMLDRPELVRTLDDHVGLSTLPEAAPRLDFLFAETSAPVDHRELGTAAPVSDLTELLAGTVDRLAGLGLEVLAVRQEEAGVRERLGLHTVKVIVPGTLPMTFGHVHHRTLGLPRLLEVPHRLGRTARPLRYEDLALHPHPFP